MIEMKPPTLDQVCGYPPGTFQKRIVLEQFATTVIERLKKLKAASMLVHSTSDTARDAQAALVRALDIQDIINIIQSEFENASKPQKEPNEKHEKDCNY